MNKNENLESLVTKGKKTTTSNQTTSKDTKNRKGLIVGIVAVVLVVTGVGGYFLWQSMNAEANGQYASLISQAEISISSREYADAINTLNSAVEIRPKKKEAYKLTIEILADKYQLSDATEVLIAAEPVLSGEEVAQFYGVIGQKYYDLNDYTNAQKYLEQSTKRASLEEYQKTLVLVYLAQGNLDSIDKYAKSHDVFAGHWDDYQEAKDNEDLSLFDAVKKAREYINAGFPYLAIGLLEGKTEDMAEYWEGLYFLGKAYLDHGDSESALGYFEQALTLGSEDADLYTLTARAQYIQKDVDSMTKSYDRALAFATEDVRREILFEYIPVLITEELPSKATAVLVEYGNNEDVDHQYLYMTIYYADGDMDKVGGYVENIATLEPEDNWKYMRDYLIVSTRYYINERNYDKAEELIAQLEDVDKYDPYVQLLSAIMAIEKDDSASAKEYLHKALDYDLTGEVVVEAERLLGE